MFFQSIFLNELFLLGDLIRQKDMSIFFKQ